jgi:predicted amidohydrolase YtcJ
LAAACWNVCQTHGYVARVKAKIALVKPGEWVTGAGWDEGKLAEPRYVAAADLDSIAPNNPVWLIHTTGHHGVANSLALKLAHITAATADPAAGTIERDPHGDPTGILKEESAMEPDTRLIPPTTPEQMRQGILYIQQILHSEGMTAVKDPSLLSKTPRGNVLSTRNVLPEAFPIKTSDHPLRITTAGWNRPP